MFYSIDCKVSQFVSITLNCYFPTQPVLLFYPIPNLISYVVHEILFTRSKHTTDIAISCITKFTFVCKTLHLLIKLHHMRMSH